MSAVDRVTPSGFFFVLLVGSIILSEDRYGCHGQKLIPSIAIRPQELDLETVLGASKKIHKIICTTSPNDNEFTDQINEFAIKRKTETGTKIENIVKADLSDKDARPDTDGNVKGKFKIIGAIGTSTTSPSSIQLHIIDATCKDAGEYYCVLKYRGDGDEVLTNSSSRLLLKPTEMEVSRDPPDQALIPGLKVKLKCKGVVGTTKIGSKKSRLTWTRRNRESSSSTQYFELQPSLREKMQYGESERLECSERQEVSLEMTVDKERDSLTDYICIAVHTVDGFPTFLAGGVNNKIEFPSYEEKAKVGIGVGGFVGIGLGALAFVTGSGFGVIWLIRRNQKKSTRTAELERRKSQIEDRRKEIANVVEQRRGSAVAVQPEAESAAAEESSVAAEESSVAED